MKPILELKLQSPQVQYSTGSIPRLGPLPVQVRKKSTYRTISMTQNNQILHVDQRR